MTIGSVKSICTQDRPRRRSQNCSNCYQKCWRCPAHKTVSSELKWYFTAFCNVPTLLLLIRLSVLCVGIFLAGILVSGEVFLWDRDKDSLKMVTSAPAVYELASSCKGVWICPEMSFELYVLVSCWPRSVLHTHIHTASSQRLSLLVSGDGQRVLVASFAGQVFLWECLVSQDLNSFRDNTLRGRWSQIAPSENSQLPSAKDKEACVHLAFVQSQVRAA